MELADTLRDAAVAILTLDPRQSPAAFRAALHAIGGDVVLSLGEYAREPQAFALSSVGAMVGAVPHIPVHARVRSTDR